MKSLAVAEAALWGPGIMRIMQQTHIVGARRLRILSDRFGVLAFTVLRGVSALTSTAPLPARNETDIFDIVCSSILQGSPVHSDGLLP